MSGRFSRVAARLLALFAVATLVAGCSSLNPFSRKGPQIAPLPPLTSPVEVSIAAQTKVGGSEGLFLTPAILDNEAIVAGGDGRVLRWNGGTRWEAKLEDRIIAGVGADERLAVVVTRKGEVVALAVDDGTVRWRHPLQADVITPPLVAGGFVVVRAVDHRLIALDARDGKERWVYQRNLPPLSLRQSAPLVSAGNAIVAGYPGGIVAVVEPRSGAPLFDLTVASPKGATEIERLTDVVGPPLVARQEVCAAAYQGRVACFDGRTAETIWTKDLSSRTGIDRDFRYIVVTADNDDVVALDAYSGREQWRTGGFSWRLLTRPLILGDWVLVGDREGYVHVLDRNDGRIRGRVRVGSGPILVEPKSIGPNRAVVQNTDGTVAVVEVH
ncbi:MULTISPECIES: outer membrane protein assembly factor BamB [Tepidiphilus]|uniref:outer membrane protein assembly factor BamB n=1 Tax=Tepidiphilus TaxID=203470 RepID=UPI00115E5D94|nr:MULTISPECIES: outer membrane protein assembly factor BamB [Tepidiphilus]